MLSIRVIDLFVVVEHPGLLNIITLEIAKGFEKARVFSP